MKLAEALMLRADQKKKIASLRERVAANAVVQEGETPHEDPTELMKEAVAVLDEFESLVIKINAANIAAKLPDNRTLAQLIARRDTLTQQHSLLQVAVQSTRKEPDRYSMKEIKWIATVPVGKLQKQSDDLSRQIRELNGLIQEANWQIDID
jgi:hypothetical protein